MIGRMASAGLAVGHSGVGPESVCACYWFSDHQPACAVAVFAKGHDEGIAEHAAAKLAAERGGC